MSRALPLLLLLFATPIARAAAESVVPYAALYESLRPALEIGAHDHLQARTRIVSKRGDVRPEQIRLEIRARTGTRVVAVDPDGNVAFPLEAGLRAENPPVATNQPKGSLTLSVAVVLALPASTRLPYREIAEGIDQMRSVIDRDGADARVRVEGVELWFDPRAQAQLTVLGRIERLLMADRSGRIVLDDAPELREAGVMLQLTTPAREIVPVLRLEAAR
jgi:hypothetical protein